MLILERFSQESAREYVYKTLKTNIVRLTLAPGQSISEQEIADQLHVSRTPVREAFIKLAQENLLDIMPQKGTYVSLINIEHVEESKFAREIMEREIMQIACISFPAEALFELKANITLQELCLKEKNYRKFFELDESMHAAIFKGCKKGRVWFMLEQMNVHYNRVRMLKLAEGYEWEQIFLQHNELLRAIREHDTALAREMIEEHLKKFVFDLEYLQKKHAQYFLPQKPSQVTL